MAENNYPAELYEEGKALHGLLGGEHEEPSERLLEFHRLVAAFEERRRA